MTSKCHRRGISDVIRVPLCVNEMHMLGGTSDSHPSQNGVDSSSSVPNFLTGVAR